MCTPPGGCVRLFPFMCSYWQKKGPFGDEKVARYSYFEYL